MSVKIFKIDSGSRRALLIAAGLFSIAAALFSAKWGFAHAIAQRPDSTEVAALAVELGPDDPQTHYAAAVLYEKTFVPEDMEKALSEFETATSFSPNNYLLWLSLGTARERTGDQQGAELALRKALELAPNYSSVQWRLGNALLRQGKTEEAFAEIRKAVGGDPAYTNAAAATAWHLLDGDMAQVRNAIGDSTRLNAALATLLAGQKRFDESFEIWNALPDAEKKTTLKETGETLYRQFAGAKKHRFAQSIADQIEYLANSGESSGQISNGGFEDAVKMQNAGIFEWQIADGITPRIGPTEGQKHTGNYSLLLSFGQGSKEVRQVSQTVAVEPGKRYEFIAFYRAEIKSAAAFKWEIVNAADGILLSATNAMANSADWTAVKANFSVPENTDGVVIRLVRENCTVAVCQVSGNLWFDSFSLKAQ